MRDCWRRCIARVLGIEASDVPDFVGEDPNAWLANTGMWLHDRGRDLIALVPVQDGLDTDVTALADCKAFPAIACKVSEDGAVHAVVIEGSGSVWDPAPDCEGMAQGTTISMYWVTGGPNS